MPTREDPTPAASSSDDGDEAQQPPRRLRGAVIGVLVVFGVLGLWLLVTGVWAGISALGVRSDSQELSQALRDGDEQQIADSLKSLQAHAASLDARLNSVPWTQVADLPLVGPSVAAVADVAGGTQAVAQATVGNEGRIAAVSAALAEQGMRGAGKLSELIPVTEAAAQGVIQPRDEVAAAVAFGLPAPVAEVAQQFLDVADAVVGADAAVRVLPGMLGMDGPKSWLILFQNLAEPRGTGGLISAYANVDVDNGEFTTRGAETTNEIFDQAVSLAGIPADTRRLWGPDLARSYGWNLDRHFPFAGELSLRSAINRDGAEYVVSLDPVSVAGFLEVVGPVTQAGVEVSAENAVDFLTRDIYVRFPDPERKDEVAVAIIEKVIEKFFDRDPRFSDLAEVLVGTAATGHVYLYASDEDQQSALEATPVAGAIPESEGPWATVAINDNAAGKMAPFLSTEIRWESASRCSAAGAPSSLAVTITNNAPEDLSDYADLGSQREGRPRGSTTMGVAVYAPVGSAFRSVDLDGSTVPLVVGMDRRHPVWAASMELDRGQSRTFTVQFEEPRVVDSLPVFSAQPMVNPMTVAVGEAACS